MNLQDKSSILSNSRPPLGVDSINSINESNSIPPLKYPMLIFSNYYSKEAKSKNILKKLSSKSQIIFILNLTDIFFTWFFVIKNTEFFLELNPFAKQLIFNLPLTLCIKLIAVIFILTYLKLRVKTADAKGLKLINLTTNIIVILYFIVNAIHIFNFVFLIYTFNYF